MGNKENLIITLSLQGLNAEKPQAFSNRATSKETFEQLEQREIESLETEYLEKVLNVLTHPATRTLARRGEITLGMIKPNAYEGKNLGIDQDKPIPVKDDAAANRIRREIIREDENGSLGEIIFELSMQLKPQDIDEFYPDLKDQLGPENYKRYQDFMTSGPVTFFLLSHYEREKENPQKIGIKRLKKDAVNFWRTRMGATRPERANKGTIRKRFARSINNNLVHGSDSKESVIREIGVFANIIKRRLENNSLPKEASVA